ncbi:MAG TPA: DUF3459 domain-containing protein, partial [Candidatus Binataceae bacterium]|nr:DUF3459 domain-containing protein [Candidatus Binataceae bacterium]
DLANALQHAFVYDGRYSKFRGRRHGRAPAGIPGYRFLGYLQNHDQIGNRARGDRSSHLMSERRLRIAAALVLTAPFIPMLFQGEEWGASTPFIYFTGHEDEELGRAVSEGRRREFAEAGWEAEEIPDPQALESFTRSKLDWQERGREPHKSLLDWHQNLIKLRKRCRDLNNGNLENVRADFDEQARWLLMTRGSIGTACNFASETRRIILPSSAKRKLLMASDPLVRLTQEAIELPGESAAIITDSEQ